MFPPVLNISGAVLDALLPVLKGIKTDINNLKELYGNISDTVINLEETVEEHKSQTSSELAHLQSSIDNPPTDEIATAVLLKLLPYLNNVEDDLSEKIDESVNSLSGDLSSINGSVTDLRAKLCDLSDSVSKQDEALTHLNETVSNLKDAVEKQTVALANLHERIDDSMNNLTGDLQDGLSMINGNITELRDKVCNISDTVSNMNETVSSLEETVEEHERQTKLALDDLQEKVDDSAKGLAEDFQVGLSSLNGTVTDVRVKVCDLSETIGELKTETTSQLTDVHSWDLSNVTGDMQCIKIELKQISSHLENNPSCSQSSIPTTTELRPSPTMDVSQTLPEPYPLPSPSFSPPPIYECGGPGWRRVVYLNMTDPNTNCPSGWELTEHSKRTYCGRSSSGLSCDSVFFPVYGVGYTRVCGTIKAYQFDYTEGFEEFNRGYVTTIDGAYVDGIVLTHGTPRQHIWTFAAGVAEDQDVDDACPCDATIDIAIPPFVGGDYFCESGVNSGSFSGFHPDDPLWDGHGCTSNSTCCSFNNPPYFTKQLSRPTTDDIEARICQQDKDGDTPIELIELYVQ